MKKYELLKQIKDILINNSLSLSSAESCTGGLISSYLTDIDGASNFIFQNFVTYSNDAKMKFLDVKDETLKTLGAVSQEVAYQMALGLLNYGARNKKGAVSIATTGILGPTGGSKEKPIGLVYIGFGYKNYDDENKDIIKVIKYISKKADTNDRHKIKKDIVKHSLFEFLIFLEENVKK